MEITSFSFFLLVGISLVVYLYLPYRFQWGVLLFDSVLFYFANASWGTFVYICVSVASIYSAVHFFHKKPEASAESKRKCVLILAIVLNAGILVILKYMNLVIHTWNFFGERILHVKGLSDVAWLAPMAVSFYTLQLLAYLLDCYWGSAEPFGNPLRLGLYTIYFPLMTSGPICRYDQVGKQLFEEHRFDYNRVKFGLYRIAWGLLKKLAVSNRIAVVVDQMWDLPQTSTGISVWIAVFLFLIQLYTDFSGCMDIALGVSSCFGIVLPENFKAPFYSRNMQEFWRRWHITLGTWLRDYIMNPILKSDGFIRLGGWCRKKFGKKRGKKIPSYLAMLVLWSCMGLWHGNSWKYIVGEGVWFWFVIVGGQILEPCFKKAVDFLKIKTESVLWHGVQTVRTFLLWAFGMLFFRADSLRDSFARIAAGFRIRFDFQFLYDIKGVVDFSEMGGKVGILLLGISLICILIVDFLKYREVNVMEKISQLNWKWRWMLYYVLVIVLYMSLNIASQESIYAQF